MLSTSLGKRKGMLVNKVCRQPFIARHEKKPLLKTYFPGPLSYVGSRFRHPCPPREAVRSGVAGNGRLRTFLMDVVNDASLLHQLSLYWVHDGSHMSVVSLLR